MNDHLLHSQVVELFYTSPPQLDGNLLLSELRHRCGPVNRLGDKEDFYLYAFPDPAMEESKIPPLIFIGYPDESKENRSLEETLQQSWGWREARTVIAACPSSLIFSEMMAQSPDPRARLMVFHCALEAMLTVAPCQAIHWAASQQMVSPAAYLQARQAPNFHPLQFAVNVRFYNISNGQPGEMLMDTMGLGTLGLPDLQCHFVNLDPNEVGRVLFNSAYYLFDNGDVIEDGHTIQGIKATDRWKCQHEKAIVQPEREVLDLNPGKPHAAGNRK